MDRLDEAATRGEGCRLIRAAADLAQPVRGEMAEMVWRILEKKTDQPAATLAQRVSRPIATFE